MSRSNSAYWSTDSGGSSRPSTYEFTYDELTGKWGAIPTISTDNNKDSPTPGSNSNSKVDSKTAAEKEYIEIEFNTLVGELVLTSTEKSIRLKVNDTIRLEGVGKYLSGQYFISAIRRTISKDAGYTHTLTLIKNGFGDSLKKSQTGSNPETRKEEVQKGSPDIKVGDSVRIVGDNAVYSNAHDGVKVPAWVKQKTLTVDAISTDGTRVRLNPIWSWTYLKFIQKV